MSQSPTAETVLFALDNLWILIAAALVFVMHLGFACIESGLTRAKNTVNILAKNVAIVSIGMLTYAAIGFGLMYPTGVEGGWLPFLGPGGLGALLGVAPPPGGMTPEYADYTYWADFVFQAMFAATAATIVSGAVAERIRIGPFLVFSTIYVALIYPLVGFWKWGGGWLEEMGFYDFAGSTLVHSVGGWGALAGALVLGPRIGKYMRTAEGALQIRPIMGHSMPLATIGMFLLWFGWFGFNGGSVLSAAPTGGTGLADYGFGGVSLVFMTTMMGAAAGIAGATVFSWLLQGKPDLSMMLNGALAGLVAITAGADAIGIGGAVVIGGIGGVLVVGSVILLDRLHLDDPVGAVSVHLCAGIWGTLAVGLFSDAARFGDQLTGVLAVGALCFPVALLLFLGLRATVGLRVSREEELLGLDIGEHGMEAYSGFQFFTTQ
ncbi:MAG: ammonium transporter [Gemmatimonadota bacterium]